MSEEHRRYDDDNLDEVCKLRGCDKKFDKVEDCMSTKVVIWIVGIMTVAYAFLFVMTLTKFDNVDSKLNQEVQARIEQRIAVETAINNKLDNITRKIEELRETGRFANTHQ